MASAALDREAAARLDVQGGDHAVLDDHGVALGPGAEAEAAAVHLEARRPR